MDHNTLRRFTQQPMIGNMDQRILTMRGKIIDAADFAEHAAGGPCRELSLALTALEEALMWANKAIVMGPATVEPQA